MALKTKNLPTPPGKLAPPASWPPPPVPVKLAPPKVGPPFRSGRLGPPLGRKKSKPAPKAPEKKMFKFCVDKDCGWVEDHQRQHQLNFVSIGWDAPPPTPTTLAPKAPRKIFWLPERQVGPPSVLFKLAPTPPLSWPPGRFCSTWPGPTCRGGLGMPRASPHSPPWGW